jgi:hypothetical protein
VEIQMGLHDPIPNQLVVHRAAPGGTVFLHGIFFAHDAEKPGFTVGSTEPAYRPRSEAEIRTAKDWFRPAS